MASGVNSQVLIRNGLDSLDRALAWWLRELGEILEWCLRWRNPNLVEFGVSAVDEPVPLVDDVERRRGAGRKLLLRIDDSAFLFRKIKLPAAARKNLDRVVGYEFNRYFPMDAENALFACEIVTAGSTTASIEVEIRAISKKTIDAYLSLIRRQYEIEVGKLAIANSEGRVLITRDFDKERRLEDKSRSARLRMLNIAIIGLLLALFVYPLERMDSYLEYQQQQIASLEKQAAPIIQLRQKTLALNQRFTELADSNRDIPDPVSIWSYLTRVMADHALLDRLEISGRDVRVIGEATSVEALLRSLESESRITDVRINGPVKATRDGLNETMNLTLTIKGGDR